MLEKLFRPKRADRVALTRRTRRILSPATRTAARRWLDGQVFA
jgi:hypothetical protein